MNSPRDEQSEGAPDWNRTVSDAVAHVDSDPPVGDSVETPPRSRLGLLAIALVSLVVASGISWWTVTRPPQLPPVEDQAYALRRSAGAVANEVLILRAQRGSLPSRDAVTDLLDEGLTYEPREGTFTVRNTDGEIVVVYDGTMPVEQWVASGGYTLETRAKP